MINLNEVSAGFTYLGSSIKSCNIENTIVGLGSDAVYQLQIDFAVRNLPIEKDRTFRQGQVRLKISCAVSVESIKEAKTDIDIVIEGDFSADANMPDKNFSQMLLVNGISALYGIARSKIEVITSMMYQEGKIILPMINVIDLLKQKESLNNTSKE